MISIKRLAEPEVLQKNKNKWLKRFIESGDKRPPSKQYAHEKVKNTLGVMSFDKCFYCECRLGDGKDAKPEVDHHVGLSQNRNLAFEWTNLYLSCPGCNKAKENAPDISVSECLDPCDLNVNPADHLTFDDEFIRPKNGSLKGTNTIKKYKLNRSELEYIRIKKLKNFEYFLRKLREKQIGEGRKELSDDEKEKIKSFSQPDQAFSLMFSVYLKNLSQ